MYGNGSFNAEWAHWQGVRTGLFRFGLEVQGRVWYKLEVCDHGYLTIEQNMDMGLVPTLSRTRWPLLCFLEWGRKISLLGRERELARRDPYRYTQANKEKIWYFALRILPSP